ncbi:MAG TPA: RagB/SusD family nutrient uptake outer membrane protein, partial [Niastella sp.]
MKTSIFRYIISSAVIATAITSCKKDFLTVTPTSLVTEASVLSDSLLFEDYVVARYVGIRLQDKEGDGTNPGFGRGFEYAMWSSLTDESMYNNDDNTWLIQKGLLAPENTGIAGTIWGRSYRGIRDVNYAITNIDTVTMSTPRRNRLLAELKFIRAFRYHDIIRNYGGAILMGDKVTDLYKDNLQDESLFKRASLKESIDYAVAQLDDAAALLPVDNDGSWLLGRATKGAALALKSRLLLYAASPLYATGTWQAAASAAQAVISLNKYGIYTGGYSNLF